MINKSQLLPSFQSSKSDMINVDLIIIIWIFMIILVNPIGNFPLNDDWSYARSVKSAVEHGEFKLLGWTGTNLISQVYWGALFCLPFGFSFTALRFSTLTLGLIGVLSTYGLLRLINAHPKYSFLGALLVAINPIYFELSNTFMNDVPFFAFATLTLFFLFRGLKYDSTVDLVIGLLFTYITILSRQTGLVIPLVFVLAYLGKKGINLKSLIIGLLAAFVGFGLQFSYQEWLRLTMNMPELYGMQIKTIFEEIGKGFKNVTFNYTSITLFSLIYLGIFLFPILITCYPVKLKELSKRKQIISILATSIFSIVLMKILISKQRFMPLMNNVLQDFPGAPDFFWLSVTAIGVLGAAILIQYLLIASFQIFRRQELYDDDNNKRWVNIFIVSVIFIYFFPLGFLGFGTFGFYDRYLIFLLPSLTMTILVSNRNNCNQFISNKSFLIAIILILLYGSFTIGTTHDYLSRNRARWQALNYLMYKGIPPNNINGGFEFNGWFLYDPDYDVKAHPYKSWWVDKDDYLISSNTHSGYETIKQYRYRLWLPLHDGNTLVLRKIKNQVK